MAQYQKGGAIDEIGRLVSLATAPAILFGACCPLFADWTLFIGEHWDRRLLSPLVLKLRRLSRSVLSHHVHSKSSIMTATTALWDFRKLIGIAGSHTISPS